MNYLKQDLNNQAFIIDIETNGLNPDIIWCACIQNIVTGEVLTFRDRVTFNAWLNTQNDPIFIGHNLLSFDVPVLNRLWAADINLLRCLDTLVLSYLYNSAIDGGHSLAAWGTRLSFPKGDHSDWNKFSEEMLTYCKQDVALTCKLYIALTKKMLALGYSEKSAEIEHRIRLIINEQQDHGFFFDRKRAEVFRNELRQRQADLAETITKLFPPRRTKVAEYTFRRLKNGGVTASYENHRKKYPELVHVDQHGRIVPEGLGDKYECYEYIPFNLGSPKQRVERLLELGWEPEKFTEKGFPKVDEDALVAFSQRLVSLYGESDERSLCVKSLSEWLVIQGRASMLDTWFNNLGVDSRIHGRVITCGATTRRMTHNSPNTANIPSGAKAKYGHECRSFWGVEPGRGLALVGYDASGLETAGLCHYLNNRAATEVLLKPKPDDIHTANSRRLSEALGWECDREWAAKTSWYAWLYGAYEPKLGSIVGGSKNGKSDKAAGEIVIDTFFRNVPGLKPLIEEVQYEFRSNRGRLETIDGGYVLCPSINAALNYRIQSAGAIVMKLTSILLHDEAKKIGLDFQRVGDIHDEGQLEVREEYAPTLGALAVDCITRAGRDLGFRVELTGDFKIGDNWSMTH